MPFLKQLEKSHLRAVPAFAQMLCFMSRKKPAKRPAGKIANVIAPAICFL
jgi:hypothetical protein